MQAGKILSTPELCFEDLKDYPFQPHFVKINNLKIHYVDEGPVDLSGMPWLAQMLKVVLSMMI